MNSLVFRMTLAEFIQILGYNNNIKNSTCYDILTCGSHRTMLTLFFHLYLGLNSEPKASLEDVYLFCGQSCITSPYLISLGIEFFKCL